MGLFTNPLGHAGYPPGVTGTPTTQPASIRAATAAEAAAGVLTDVYISPATAQSATVLDFASPPVLGFGSTTPRPVNATTLSVDTLISINGGAATDFIGTATLAAGTVTIANTNIAAGDRILVVHAGPNASTGIGTLTYSISAGASFTVTSRNDTAGTETGDLSTIVYVIFRQT